MDLVVDEVEQLEDVHVADGHLLVERLAALAVEQLHLSEQRRPAGRLLVHVHDDRRVRVLLRPRDERLVDVRLGRAVEHGRRRRGSARSARARSRPPSSNTPCAAAQPRCVSRIWPMFIRLGRRAGSGRRRPSGRPRGTACPPRDDLGDDALVSVAAGELVALGDLALLRDVDADELVDARRRSSPASRENVLTSITLPPSPCGTFSDVSRTSRAFSLKIARISFSSAVSSVSPFGVTLPTSRSPEPTSAPMRTTPRSSRFASDSSERFGMSRVISSSPSFVERASISYSWMWIELSTSSLTSRSERRSRPRSCSPRTA